MSDPPEPLHVGVAREELDRALRTLRRTVPKRRGMPEALITCDAGDLVIRMGGAEVRASAWGRWSGFVRAAGQNLVTLDRFLPEQDPVPVRVRDGRIKIGRSSFPCAWQETVPDSLLVPVDASLLHVLRLPERCSEAAIEEAGLSQMVAEALARKEEILERATRTLLPLEIRREALERCLEARMREKFEARGAD